MSLSFNLETEVDTGGEKLHTVYLFDISITHNLNEMAGVAGLYDILWRSKENGYLLAEDIIEKLELGIAELEKSPEHYKQYNPKNGWGSYDSLVYSSREILEACKKHPKADIRVWR